MREKIVNGLERNGIMLSGALRMSTKRLKLIDIGANLTDAMFQGIYHGKQAHKADLTGVLDRAFDIGLEKIIVTGGNLEQSRQALDLAGIDDRLYSTVGVHPTYCSLFTDPNNGYEGDPDKYQEELLVLATSNRAKVVAVGECGLDFERLHYCPKEVQLQYFEKQLILSKKTGLPLFLHCRNAFPEFMGILEKNKEMIVGGVVHSFDGTLEEALTAVDFGLYIGINGCSLKTEENLAVVKQLPLEKLMIETDSPWCDIRPSHTSYKYVQTQFSSKKKEKWEQGTSIKGRNEPRNTIQVLEVVSALHEKPSSQVAEQIYRNTCTLFNWPS